MERVLKIDPEFQNKIPPLTADEFKQLEENIMDAGEVYEPITVWNNTIIDGHNRYKIVLMHPGIRWRVREANFADKWEAFGWMYKNQLGRRNLTDEQKTVLIGEMYKARKHTHGGNRRSGEFSSNQNDNLKTQKQNRVANQIADELNVSPASVVRAEMYVNGLDAIREEEPELADSIMNASKKVSKQTIRDIGQARPEVRKIMIDDIKSDKKKRITKSETKELLGIADTLTNDTCMEYTIDHMTEQIRVNADAFIRSLSNLIMDHTDVTNGHQAEIVKAIDENVTKRIMQIKEILNNGTQL